MLSILIPTYNSACAELVAELERQATKSGIDFEIVVAEDGSTNAETIAANAAICQKSPNYRHIVRKVNVGRAAIRNFLAVKARYDTLLYIDSGNQIQFNNFIAQYIKVIDTAAVIYGGFRLAQAQTYSLRYRYEQKYLLSHPAEVRNRQPYAAFHTNNLLINRQIVIEHPFDETLTTYGYEDALFGLALQQNDIAVVHIDNPVTYTIHDTNQQFVAKTEEALRTLYTINQRTTAPQLQTPLTRYATRLKTLHLYPLIRLKYRIIYRQLRNFLIHRHVSITLYNAYRLLFYISIDK